jgi:hypothetical protein
MAMRGIDQISATAFLAEIGDLSRFRTPRELMAYLGLVPSEHSSGQRRRIGSITKAGDIHARTLLIEAAHSYRLPARIARRKLKAVDAVPDAVRAIAWKAQTRLCQRYRQMMTKDKLKQIIVTAIARELAGFVWAIACITSDPPGKIAEATVELDITAELEGVCAGRSTGRSRAPLRVPLDGATLRAAATYGLPAQTSAATPGEEKVDA